MVPPAPVGAEFTAARELRKAVLSAFFGALIEWYDFFLYSAATALVFPQLFFPGSNPSAGLMKAFAIYAVGFVARPIGSVIFGHLGDRLGRKATLVWTITLMGGSTFLIGCLPSYETAGALGPVLLVLLRFGQGLAIGGEWGGSALLAVEHGHKSRRGFHGSWAHIGVPAGLLLANAVFWLAGLPGPEFLAQWGWRICFWCGLVLTFSGLAIRRRVAETPLFAQAARAGAVARNPLAQVLREQWRKVLLVIGIRFAENTGFYVLSAYVLAYAKDHATGAVGMVQRAILAAALVESFTLPAWAALSDRWGRRVVCLLGNGLFAIIIFPFFGAVAAQNEVGILVWLVILMGIVHGAMFGPQPAFFAELFPTKLRYSGASLGYGLTAPLAGGLAPFICEWLVRRDAGAPWYMCVYLAAIGLLSCVAVFLAKETYTKDIAEN